MSALLDDIGLCPATLLADPMAAGPAEVEAVARAASAAGDRSLSMWAFQVQAYGVDAAAALFADDGLRVRAVEAAMAWTGGATEAMRAEADGLIDTAQRLGADLLMAVTLDPTIDTAAATDGLAGLTELAASAGLRTAVEFLPWSGIATLAAADELVAGCANPAAGIVVDCWHWQRQPGGPDLDLLRSLPGDRIAYLQLCDAAPSADASGDLYAEAMSARRVPGEGVVDLAALLAALDEIGARPFVASEVFSAEVAALGPDAAARRIHDACAALRPLDPSGPGGPDAR